MADRKQMEPEIVATPPAVAQNHLEVNPFREPARQASGNTVTSIVSKAATATQIAVIGGIPLIRGDYAAAILDPIGSGGQGALNWKAFRDGKDFIIVRFANGRQMAYATAESSGLAKEAMDGLAAETANGVAYVPGKLPAVEKLIADFKLEAEQQKSEGAREAKTPVAVYVAKPLDCLQFVNSAITSAGARKVNHHSGHDLAAALAQPGKAIIQTRDNLLQPGEGRKRPMDEQKVTEFFQNARTGDVVLFLMDASLGNVDDGRDLEKQNGDKVIWLDNDGRLIDTSLMKGTERPGRGYAVSHSGVYAGLDADGHPTSAQAHVCRGNISVDILHKYLAGQGKLEDAVAVISLDYFMKEQVLAAGGQPAASGPGPGPLARATQ